MRKALLGLILLAFLVQPTPASSHPNTNDFYTFAWDARVIQPWSYMKPAFPLDAPNYVVGDESVIQPTAAQQGAIERAIRTVNRGSSFTMGEWSSTYGNRARYNCAVSPPGDSGIGVGMIDGKGVEEKDAQGNVIFSRNTMGQAQRCIARDSKGRPLVDSRGRLLIDRFTLLIDKDDIGEMYTGTGTDTGGKADLESIAVHEILHVTGRGTQEDGHGHWMKDGPLCQSTSREVLCPSGQRNSLGRVVSPHDAHLLKQAYPLPEYAN